MGGDAMQRWADEGSSLVADTAKGSQVEIILYSVEGLDGGISRRSPCWSVSEQWRSCCSKGYREPFWALGFGLPGEAPIDQVAIHSRRPNDCKIEHQCFDDHRVAKNKLVYYSKTEIVFGNAGCLQKYRFLFSHIRQIIMVGINRWNVRK